MNRPMFFRLPIFAPAFAALRPYFGLALVALPGLLIFSYFVNLFDSGATHGAFSICVFRDLTALPCPGCGLTRALAALLAADWRAALYLHPLSPFVLVAVAGFAVGAFWEPGAWLLLRLNTVRVFVLAIVLFFGTGLLRMGLVALRPEIAREFVYDFSRDRGPLTAVFERFSP